MNVISPSSIISDTCIIRDSNIKNTEISDYCYIQNSVITNSIISNNAEIYNADLSKCNVLPYVILNQTDIRHTFKNYVFLSSFCNKNYNFGVYLVIDKKTFSLDMIKTYKDGSKSVIIDVLNTPLNIRNEKFLYTLYANFGTKEFPKTLLKDIFIIYGLIS